MTFEIRVSHENDQTAKPCKGDAGNNQSIEREDEPWSADTDKLRENTKNEESCFWVYTQTS